MNHTDLKTTNKIINIDGSPVNLEIKQLDADTPDGLSFVQWATATRDLTPLAAWNYKQGEIECLILEWNDSVLFGKDKLKESIESVTRLNNKLSGENAQLRKELDECTKTGNNFI